MRTFVLGDIHGGWLPLQQVLERSGFDSKHDRLIQIGDICDRGLYSYEVAETLRKFDHLVLIEGNHDTWLKAFMRDKLDDSYHDWLSFGGRETLISYERNNQPLTVHKDLYDRQVPYFIDEKNRCFVHAGFNRSLPIKGQPLEILTFDRRLANDMLTQSDGKPLQTADCFSHIFIGHTPTTNWGIKTPLTRLGVTNMDTGCGKGYKLSIMEVDSGRFWQSD